MKSFDWNHSTGLIRILVSFEIGYDRIFVRLDFQNVARIFEKKSSKKSKIKNVQLSKFSKILTHLAEWHRKLKM